MGTQVEIEIFDTGDFSGEIQKGFVIFAEMEHVFSRFRSDSILCQFNQGKIQEVPNIFLEVFQKAQYFYDISQGYFNPCIQLGALGYDRSFELLRGESSFAIEMEKDGCSDFGNSEIRDRKIFLTPGQELDFGGIVKGFTVDLIKRYFTDQGIKNFLINAGGDIYMSGRCHQDELCIVGIDNPFDTTKLAATFSLHDSATATSGIYKRKWTHAGKDYHHILNPHTGKNPSDIVSLTVVAPDCVTADVYATIGIAMGYERAKIFFQEQKIPALFILAHKKIAHNAYWTQQKLEILSL